MTDYSIIPELGHLALIAALPTALVMSILPLLGAQFKNQLWMRSGIVFATGQWLFLVLAFACLVYAFLTDDFSLLLTVKHSNTLLPDYYKVSAVWGNHEGSLLLWVLILASWTLAVAYLGRSLPETIHAQVLSVLGMVSVGFLSFIVFTSNPFTRNLLSIPVEGNDLNPLLQDIGLILHPPMLYIGYVGFSVVFAFAIAALISGKLDAAWARWSRPWTNVAWAFLTVGIALGSWWAYYELGWGGWWFWDPVENASFMPWLAGTALIHSLAVTEKRGVFRSWTVLLAILAFSLSLLGTFLVRSGILVSVHAFASDPTRGLYILGFLIVVIGGSLLLYALRAPTIKPLSSFSLVSRESLLLINNIILAVALSVVLLGTLFPLIASAMNLGSYSVGPPYFNRLFIPLMIPMMLLMGIASSIHWKKTQITPLIVKPWYMGLVFSLITSFAWMLQTVNWLDETFSISGFVVITIALFLIVMTLYSLFQKASRNKTITSGLQKIGYSYWGMVLAHVGIGITAIGICYTSLYSQQRDVRMGVADTARLNNYTFNLIKIENVAGPNYTATRGNFQIYYDGKSVTYLKPEKRLYHAGRNVMTEAAIQASLSRDIYISMGEPIEDGQGDWAIRLYIKPYVRLIWLGFLLMGVGGILAILDKRYRLSTIKVKENVRSVATDVLTQSKE